MTNQGDSVTGAPGSDEAIEAGCKCPVLDNGHGWGYITEGQFVIAGSCPLHAEPAEPVPPVPHKRPTPEILAQAFHEAYETLAPLHGYQTREASAVPWEAVPEQNKGLMVTVAAKMLEQFWPAERPAEGTSDSDVWAVGDLDAVLQDCFDEAGAIVSPPDAYHDVLVLLEALIQRREAAAKIEAFMLANARQAEVNARLDSIIAELRQKVERLQ